MIDIEMEIRDKNIYLKIPYRPNFNEKMKRILGAKWDKIEKRWVIDQDLKDRLDEMLIKRFFYTADSKLINVEYSATDFYKDDSIVLNGISTVYRVNHYSPVKLYNTVIIKGDFPEKGVNKSYPSVTNAENLEDIKDIVLRTTISEELYNLLSDEDRNKLTIVNKNVEKKKEKTELELYIEKEQRLLNELKEIRSIIKKLDKNYKFKEIDEDDIQFTEYFVL